MKNSLIYSLGLLALVSQLACSKADTKAGVVIECGKGGDATVGIINGTEVSREAPLAKRMVFVVQPTADRDDGRISICSGTLIDNDVVLTAAHCVDEAKYASEVRISFTADGICDLQNSTGESVFATRVRMHPAYDKNSRSKILGDLALVRMEKPRTDGKLVYLSDTFVSVKDVYSPVLIAGYGRDNDLDQNSNGSSGRLRYTKVRPMEWEKYLGPSGRTVGKESREDYNSIHSPLIHLSNRDGTGACSGDSGGPAFIQKDGRLVQAGVASYVFGEYYATCTHGIAYVNLHYYKDWIQKEFASLRSSNSSFLKIDTSAPFRRE